MGASITGNVCPDDNGHYNACCHQSAKCSYENQCPGLAGDCCPTPGGMMLGCCKNKKKGEAAEDAEWLSQSEDVETTPQVTDELLLTVGVGVFIVFAIGVAVGVRFTRHNKEQAEYQ